MLSVRVFVVVRVSVMAMPSVSAVDQSCVYPTVTVAVGPRIMYPAIILTDKLSPWLWVTDFSFVRDEETETDTDCKMSQVVPPLQLSVWPSTCCGPALV